jgi:hypothetical protein
MSPAPKPPDDPSGFGELQFQTAEPLPAPASGPSCVACKQPIEKTYYHAQGATVCELCAQRIQSGQQAPPPLSLARAVLYGSGAALAGCILYALVAILFRLEIGLIAIVVGVIVGKSIRYASKGMGGRPQQILAVILTYFAITTSYLVVFIYNRVTNPTTVQQQAAKNGSGAASAPMKESEPKTTSLAGALLMLALITLAAPFLALTGGVSALISLFIIFIGLQRAWKLTGRSDILVMGPYEVTPAP